MTYVRYLETGEYTGNGTSQSISIGWRPALVVTAKMKNTGPGSRKGLVFKIDTMPNDEVVISNFNWTEIDNAITITDDGFSVNNQNMVNRNNEDVAWFAIRSGIHTFTGSYVGSSPTNTLLDIQSDLGYFLLANTTDIEMGMKTDWMNDDPDLAGGAGVWYWQGDGGGGDVDQVRGVLFSGASLSGLAPSYPVGNPSMSGLANTNGSDYYWFMTNEYTEGNIWKTNYHEGGNGATSGIRTGSTQLGASYYYFGDNSSPQSFDLGFQPSVVMIIMDRCFSCKINTMPAALYAFTGYGRYDYKDGITILSNGFEIDNAELQAADYYYVYAWR